MESTPKTTEDLVAEYPEGQEAELTPAAETSGGPGWIEPYEGATEVEPGQPDGPEDNE